MKLVDKAKLQWKRVFGANDRLQKTLAEGHQLRKCILCKLEGDYSHAAQGITLIKEKDHDRH